MVSLSIIPLCTFHSSLMYSAWSVLDSVTSRLATLWLGYKSWEFSWTYLQSAVNANISIVLSLLVFFLFTLPHFFSLFSLHSCYTLLSPLLSDNGPTQDLIVPLPHHRWSSLSPCIWVFRTSSSFVTRAFLFFSLSLTHTNLNPPSVCWPCTLEWTCGL